MLIRLLANLHGYLGVLALAALVHPALLLRRGRPLTPRGKWAVGLAALFAGLAFASGVLIYEDYRALVRRPLFRASPTAGLLFETKEHLAFAALALALGAAVCALAAPRAAQGLRRLAAAAFAGAAVLVAAVTASGLWIAAVRGFE